MTMKSTKLDTKCALTCTVPEISQIQDIRKVYDTAYNRWMPHFNIGCFPFYQPDDNPDILPKIQTICKKYDTINITLDKLQNFPPSGRTPGTLYAAVLDSSGILSDLYNDLMKEFNFNTNKKFTPHVTLGRFTSTAQLDKVQKSIDWTPITFTLKSLDFIQRGTDTPFEVKYRFYFGSDSYETVESAQTETETETDSIIQPVINEDYFSTVSNFKDYYIYNISPICSVKPKPKTLVSNFLLIDNSGSMGINTKYATDIIGKGLIDMNSETVQNVPGEILLFSSKVDKIEKLENVSSLNNLSYPSQGQTNITAAVITAINRIVEHSNKYNHDNSIHYILTFLSDGGHNCGGVLTELDISSLKTAVVSNEIKLSIIVVGISSNDTRLGMRVKTNLETLPITGLKSVYYATSTTEMKDVLKQLVSGCQESLTDTSCINIETDLGIFIDCNVNSMKKIVSDNTVIAVKSNKKPMICIDSKLLKCVPVQCQISDISKVVDSVLPKLSQIKIAYGTDSISNQINTLNSFIETADSFFSAVKDDKLDISSIGKTKLKPGQRVSILKKIRQSQISFQEERNKLKLLQAQVSNDSHKQAEYLNGFNKKYASKACIKSGMLNVEYTDVVEQIKTVLPKLADAIQNDKKINIDPQPSMLSLNTPLEQFEEWLDIDLTQSQSMFTDIYSLMVQFGFSCYPVKFSFTNAVQMDPFQTECTYIEPFMADTANIMLANQLKMKLTTPSNNVYTDGLMLLEPSASSSFKVLMQTYIYQYICSVTMCRDLYMYNHNMTFAMHAHSLVKTIDNYYETGSKAHIYLALKIVYSFKTIGHYNIKLFNRWWNDWLTITQSEDDNCNHPVQLLLMLACQTSLSDNWLIPFVNLINELLARHMKIKFYDIEDRLKVVKLMQSIFGINDDNSPKPNPDVLVEEPDVEITRETCQPWIDGINTYALFDNFKFNNISEIVNNIVLKYARTFSFAYELSKIGNWEEKFVKNDDNLLETICASMKIDNIFEQIGVATKDVDNVANTMFLQSVLHRTSQTRYQINLKDVLDATTLQNLIVDLRMEKYFEQCRSKKEKWLSVIGNVSFQKAHDTDANGLMNMIGVHTHRFTKDEFWGILEAVVDDNEKLEVFLNKSSSTVSNCVNKIKNKRR